MSLWFNWIKLCGIYSDKKGWKYTICFIYCIGYVYWIGISSFINTTSNVVKTIGGIAGGVISGEIQSGLIREEGGYVT